jgi:hypothetical protein
MAEGAMRGLAGGWKATETHFEFAQSHFSKLHDCAFILA